MSVNLFAVVQCPEYQSTVQRQKGRVMRKLAQDNNGIGSMWRVLLLAGPILIMTFFCVFTADVLQAQVPDRVELQRDLKRLEETPPKVSPPSAPATVPPAVQFVPVVPAPPPVRRVKGPQELESELAGVKARLSDVRNQLTLFENKTDRFSSVIKDWDKKLKEDRIDASTAEKKISENYSAYLATLGKLKKEESALAARQTSLEGQISTRKPIPR